MNKEELSKAIIQYCKSHQLNENESWLYQVYFYVEITPLNKESGAILDAERNKFSDALNDAIKLSSKIRITKAQMGLSNQITAKLKQIQVLDDNIDEDFQLSDAFLNHLPQEYDGFKIWYGVITNWKK